MMKTKTAIAAGLLFFLCVSALYSANAAWKNNAITMNPASPALNQKVTFSAVLVISGGEMWNLRVRAGVDSTVLYDKTLYYLFNNQEARFTIEWNAQAGRHTAFFEVEATDSLPSRADGNPRDNRVTKTFNIGDPCLRYVNEPTDLEVFQLNVRRRSGDIYEYEALLVNHGRRCIKSFWFKFSNLGDLIKEARKGNPSGSTYYLKGGGRYTLKGTFRKRGPFKTIVRAGKRYARFEFYLDHKNLIPDPNRRNNNKYFYLPDSGK
jgi:hypothetical protein